MTTYGLEFLGTLHRACKIARGSAAKGAALEELVEHVFSQVPSVRLYARDVKDHDGAQEIDLSFSHLHFISLIPIPDVTFMVECKNEAKKTSAAQVREFGSKLRSRSLPIGIIVTAAGLSGRSRTHGHAAIRDELASGVAIIVVTTRELALLHGTQDLSSLLTNRLNELRTYRGYESV